MEGNGRAVSLLLPLLFLPEEQKQLVAQELMNALSPEEKTGRADFLFVLLPYLPEEQKQQAVQEVLHAISTNAILNEEIGGAAALFVLLFYVPEEQKQQVVQEVLQALSTKAKWKEEKTERAEALFVLLPYLSEEQKQQAVQEVLRDLPEEQKHKAVQEVLQGIVEIVDPQNSEDRLPAQVTLLPYLPEDRKRAAAREAICAILAVMTGTFRAKTLVAIARYLPEHLKTERLREAFEDALAERSKIKRRNELNILIPHLPASLLPEVLIAVRGVTDADRRLQMLLALASRQFEPPLQDILQAVQGIKHEERRVWAMTMLAPQLSEVPHPKVQLNIRSLTDDDEDTRAEEEALATMFPSLPKTLIQADIGGERRATYEGLRAEIVARISSYLSEKQKYKTVRKVLELEIEEGEDWIRILEEMIPYLLHLPPTILYPLWCELLHILARTSRQELLLNMRVLTPLILRLDGPGAAVEVCHAILAVGNWWP